MLAARNGQKKGVSGPHGAFRVEQFGEARIVGHVAEVRIVACLEAGSRVQADGLGKVLQALTGAACQALQHGKAVPNEVELGILDGELLQVLARADEVTIVHQGDGEVVVLFGRNKAVADLLDLLPADLQVYLGAVRQFADS